jgi:hypothetical protein
LVLGFVVDSVVDLSVVLNEYFSSKSLYKIGVLTDSFTSSAGLLSPDKAHRTRCGGDNLGTNELCFRRILKEEIGGVTKP